MSINGVNQQPSFTGAYARMGNGWANMSTLRSVSENAVKENFAKAGKNSIGLFLNSFSPIVTVEGRGLTTVPSASLKVILTGVQADQFKAVKPENQKSFLNGIFEGVAKFNNLRVRRVKNPSSMFMA